MTIIGSVVNVLLLMLKFVAGVLGNSSAKDRSHEYGHGKFEMSASTSSHSISFKEKLF